MSGALPGMPAWPIRRRRRSDETVGAAMAKQLRQIADLIDPSDQQYIGTGGSNAHDSEQHQLA